VVTNLQCGEAYTKDNVIPINPPESAIPALQERLDRLAAEGRRHSLAKLKKDKKRKNGEEGDEKAEKKRRNSTMRDNSLVSDTVKLVQKIANQGHATGDRSAAVASLFHTGEKTPVRWNDSFGVRGK
jgi:hypothetical protein